MAQALRTAVVTGAGSGLGRAIARALADDGWSVALLGRTRAALEETAAAGGTTLVLPCDVTDERQVDRAFAAVHEAWGRLDMLVNNAGTFGPSGEVDQIAVADWRATVEVNLTGMFLCTRGAVRLMKTQDPPGGRIINNGSISAHVPRPGSVAYTATKHAVTGLTRAVALDGRAHGIAVGQIVQHLLGDAVTMPSDRGVFLTETRRMHPDLCTFISENIYEGRLSSHVSCAVQDTEFGTGLRWLRADHEGRSTHAAEEVELVHAEIRRLLGTKWVNQYGEASPLTVRDFLVVAPYNDQVDLLRERLEADPLTRGVAVGPVDKFQGRQAAVVLFSMTTSAAEHMPRSADFLFSRNRLNVVISRARCLAYLVCTEKLLDSRGRDVEERRLISTLCAFAASARRME